MADKTPNLGLVKPLLTEKYDVGIFNGNADIVDAAITEANRKITELRDISPPAEYFADYTQGGMFDFSIMTEKMRFEILYGASTEFEDAPDLLYLDGNGKGRIMFEVDELPEGYAQQTIICLAGSGAVFRRTGVGVEWDEWRAVCSPCMTVKVQFGSGTEIDLSEEIAAHFPWESKAYSYADVYSPSPSAPGAYFADGKLHLSGSSPVTLTYNLLFRDAYDSGIFKLQTHESKTTIHTTAAEKKLWDEALAHTRLNRDSIGFQSKNLLKSTAESAENNGVTFTVNEDGSVVANGTAASTATFVIARRINDNDGYPIEKGKYILSGCPTGGSETTYSIMISYEFNSQGLITGKNDYGEGAEVSIYYDYYAIAIKIQSGTTCEDLTFYPMLRHACIEDDTYEPYKPNIQEQIRSNKECCDKNFDFITELALAQRDDQNEIKANSAYALSTDGYRRKNLLKNSSSTTEKNGLTFTINADGSVSVSGTATATSALDIGKTTLTAGEKYTLSGCPEGGDELTYSLYGLNTTSWVGLGGRDTGSGHTFTASAGEVVIRVNINQGTTIDKLTFYPMLRYAAIEDGTYETYTPSLLERIEALEAKLAAQAAETEA